MLETNLGIASNKQFLIINNSFLMPITLPNKLAVSRLYLMAQPKWLEAIILQHVLITGKSISIGLFS